MFKPSFVSDWQPIASQNTTLSVLTINHNLGELPIKAEADVKVTINGADFVFQASGSAEVDDDRPNPYGATVCFYDENKVVLYTPLSTAKPHGGILYLGK